MSWPVNRSGWSRAALQIVASSQWSGRKCGEISTVTLLHSSGVCAPVLHCTVGKEGISTKCRSIVSGALSFLLPQLQLSGLPGLTFISHAAKVTNARHRCAKEERASSLDKVISVDPNLSAIVVSVE